MRDVFEVGQWLKILLVGIIIVLLGLYPLPKALSKGLEPADDSNKLGSTEIIVADLVNIAEMQPWRYGFWEAAGEAAQADGDIQCAALYFARSAAKGELSGNGYLAWGDADWQTGNPKTALQIWEIAKHLGISSDEILARQAEAYRYLGDDLALIETLQALIRHPSFADRSSSDLGSLNHELGLILMAYKPASAIAYLTNAVEYDPTLEPNIRSLIFDIQRGLSKDNPAYLLVVSGRALAKDDSWNLAEKAFQNAVELQPNYAEAWAYLGEANQHTSSEIDPLPSLTTALEIDPDSISANIFLGFYFKRNAQHETALDYFEKVRAIDPENSAYLMEIGNLEALLGDLESGKDYYWQAIELSSFDPNYVREFLKFSIEYNLDLHDVALPVARQIVLLDPDNPASLNLMGELLVRLGDMQNAERFLLRALSEDPNDSQTNLLLGQFYRNQGKLDRAELHFHQVLETSTNTKILAIAQQALEAIDSP